jgi:hypothetical protein
MTKYVTDVGGNVGESQAAKLGSHFSLMMLVTVPEAKVDELTSQLSRMPDMNASVYHPTGEKMPTPKIGCKKQRNNVCSGYSSSHLYFIFVILPPRSSWNWMIFFIFSIY